MPVIFQNATICRQVVAPPNTFGCVRTGSTITVSFYNAENTQISADGGNTWVCPVLEKNGNIYSFNLLGIDPPPAKTTIKARNFSPIMGYSLIISYTLECAEE